MTENEFIKHNRDTWDELERQLNRLQTNQLALDFSELEELSDMFQLTAAHLATARGRFAGSRTEEYLNSLVGRCQAVLYVRRQKPLKTIPEFFIRTFPMLIRRHIVPITISFVIFFGLMAIALFTTKNDIYSGKVFLGENMFAKLYYEYVQPDVRYDAFDFGPMKFLPISVYIIVNNISVALMAFISGITLFLWLYVIINNSFMIGGFMGMFAHTSHFKDLVSLLMVHGVIELTAIALAGGAGLVVLAGLIFPGQRRRVDSLRRAGKDAGQIMLGVAAMFVAAGLIEGFLTPLQQPIEWRITFAWMVGIPLYIYLFHKLVFPGKDPEKILFRPKAIKDKSVFQKNT